MNNIPCKELISQHYLKILPWTSSSSLSSLLLHKLLLSQPSPRKYPHSDTHFKPLLLHEHLADVQHPFFVSLQLHLTTLINCQTLQAGK